MYNDPDGEFFQFILLAAFWKAVMIGAIIGFASSVITAGLTGNAISAGGVLKSAFVGAISAAVTFGIGQVFAVSDAATGVMQATKFAESLGHAKVLIQGGMHAISQGVMATVQGGNFFSGALSGFLGHMGAEAWGVTMNGVGLSQFSQNTAGMITFGAISGGIGSELSGGNFWQGAITGGIVAGLNSAMHKINTNSPKDIIILNASKEVFIFGHDGTIIGNDKDGYWYMASNGLEGDYPKSELILGGKNEADVQYFKTRQEALKYAQTKYNYDRIFTIKTSRTQDFGAVAGALKQLKANYFPLHNNCNNVIAGALTGAGLGGYAGGSTIPNINFNEIRNNFLKK